MTNALYVFQNSSTVVKGLSSIVNMSNKRAQNVPTNTYDRTKKKTAILGRGVGFVK